MASNQIFIDLALINDQLTQIKTKFGPDGFNYVAAAKLASGTALAPMANAAITGLANPLDDATARNEAATADDVTTVACVIVGNYGNQAAIIESYQSQIQSLASMLALAASLAAKSASRTIGILRANGTPGDGAAADAKFGGAKVLKLLKIKMPRIKTAKKKTATKKAAPKKKTVAPKKKTVAPKKKTAAPKKKTVTKKVAPKKK